MRPELCNVMLLGEAGSGKALANNTPIPVADSRGYVPIGNLKIGDYVYDESGHSTRVTGVFPQGSLPAYRMVFSDGTEIVCNDEHLWNVRSKADRYTRAGYTTMTLREIMDKGVGEKSWLLPVARPAIRAKHNFDVNPYVIGAILALNLDMDVDLFVDESDNKFLTKLSRLMGTMFLHRTGEFDRENGKLYNWHYMRPNTDLFDYLRRFAGFRRFIMSVLWRSGLSFFRALWTLAAACLGPALRPVF